MTTTKKQSETGKVAAPAVERAVRLMDILSTSREPLSLHDLTEQLGLAKSTVHGLCQTLVQSRMITRYENGTYHLGVHIMALAHAYLERSDINSDFYAIVNELKPMPEETIVLSILDGADVVYIASRKGTRLFGFDFSMGMRLPANCAASGKAMMSTMPDEWIFQQAETGAFKELTPKSITEPSTLLKKFTQIRKTGYATDNEETRPGMICIGAPVFKANSTEAIAAIGISMPKASLDTRQKELAIQSVKSIAETLSRRLGGINTFG